MVTVFAVDGKKVTRLNDVEVGALPEAVAFTPDGRTIYVGNYMDSDFSILASTATRSRTPANASKCRASRARRG